MNFSNKSTLSLVPKSARFYNINLRPIVQLLLTICFWLIWSNLSAQTIITDRPDQTESSYSVPKGSLQLESGLLVEFRGEESNRRRQILAPTNLFRYGILKGLELRIVSQLESIKNQLTNDEMTGVSDLEVGTKIELLQKTDLNTKIAMMSHLIVPTGSEFLSRDEFGTINRLLISHQLSTNASVGYNLGYNYYGFGQGDLTYTLAFNVGVSEKVAVYIEPYGEILNIEDHEASIDAGFTYLSSPVFQWDFSFGTGLNHAMNYISVGFSWLALKQKTTP
jgi:hypothetical protein